MIETIVILVVTALLIAVILRLSDIEGLWRGDR